MSSIFPQYKLIIVSVLTAFLVSCNSISPNLIDENETNMMSLDMEKAMHQLMLSSIAIGDKETFAGLVDYPITRPYPLPDINNHQEMIAYFDLLFDEDFRKTIDSLNYNDWERMGFQGSMILMGEIWEDDGRVIAVNYSSPEEQHKRDSLIFDEIQSLHPSLQGDWEPEDRLELDDQAFGFARIDKNTVNDSLYRFSIFAKNAKVGDKPAACLNGHLEWEGRDGVTYCFRSNDTTAYFYVDFYASPDSLKTLLWMDEKIPCQNHYYQSKPIF